MDTRNGEKDFGWCTITLSIPGNQIEETAWPNRILVGLISISGSVLLGGVLISTISNIIERRVGVVYTGRMTYRNIKNHYVLIGFNELSINMIRELYDECPSARILLMSGIEAATVRHLYTVGPTHRDRETSACLLWQH